MRAIQGLDVPGNTSHDRRASPFLSGSITTVCQRAQIHAFREPSDHHCACWTTWLPEEAGHRFLDAKRVRWEHWLLVTIMTWLWKQMSSWTLASRPELYLGSSLTMNMTWTRSGSFSVVSDYSMWILASTQEATSHWATLFSRMPGSYTLHRGNQQTCFNCTMGFSRIWSRRPFQLPSPQQTTN